MNNTKTMDFKEIMEKVKEVFEEVSNFAYGEEYNISEDFKFSEDLTKKTEEYNKIYEEWKNHPGYNDSKQRDEKYEALLENFKNTPNPQKLQEIEYFESIGLGEMEEVDQYGGEGQGDTWYSVKFFPKHNVYIKVNGWYQSHSGTDFNGWEDCNEVSPKEKTITVYS